MVALAVRGAGRFPRPRRAPARALPGSGDAPRRGGRGARGEPRVRAPCGLSRRAAAAPPRGHPRCRPAARGLRAGPGAVPGDPPALAGRAALPSRRRWPAPPDHHDPAHPAAPDAPRRLLVMQYDVTGMRERELHDRQQLARLEGTISQLPAALFRLLQAAGRLEVLYASEGIRALTGLSPDEVMGGGDTLLELLEEEGIKALEVSLAQSSVGLTPCQHELCLNLPEGRRWLELRARPQRRRDGSTLWDGLLIDITERKHRERQIASLVSTDMLTGAINRRAFFEQAAALQARARRHGQSMPLAMLDLDRFKSLNDTYGHAAGDLALQAFAATCRECLRPYDLFARIGGEEFAVLLVDTPPEDAWPILERLRQAVEEIALEVEEATIRFTVSLGLAVLAPEANLDSVLGDADRALYRAKREGRNRICGPEGWGPGAPGGDSR